MMTLNGIHVSIDKKQLLHDINLHLPEGKLIGLIGPNGAGKSTLMKLLAGVLTKNSGEYLFYDQPIERISLQERAKKIGYLAQSSSLSWPLSVKQIIALGRLPYQSYFTDLTQEDQKHINLAMTHTDTKILEDRIANTLSGGELTRVLLARVLAGEPECVIADEPIASLDPYHQLQVIEILQALTRQGKTVIVSLHDLNIALRFCDTLVLLENGKVKATGNPKDVASLENIRETYQVNMSLITDKNRESLFLDSRI